MHSRRTQHRGSQRVARFHSGAHSNSAAWYVRVKSAQRYLHV